MNIIEIPQELHSCFNHRSGFIHVFGNYCVDIMRFSGVSKMSAWKYIPSRKLKLLCQYDIINNKVTLYTKNKQDIVNSLYIFNVILQ